MAFANSVTVTGSTGTAPTAGTAITASIAVTPGWYKVRGWYSISGAAETAVRNVRLALVTSGGQGDFPTTLGVNGLGWFVIDALSVPVNDNLRLQVGASGAAASTVYSGTLTATRID
jgi:hypothetical protein